MELSEGTSTVINYLAPAHISVEIQKNSSLNSIANIVWCDKANVSGHA